MSRRRNGADDLYSLFLSGGSFRNNPANNREAIMETMYLRLLTELAANRFKWSGFPDSVDVRFLELTLFYKALSVFYFDVEWDKFFALQATPGIPNMMNNPITFSVYGNRFVRKTLKATECVPIWANYLRYPDLDIVLIYAKKLAMADRTVEINLQNARQPKVAAFNENQKLSAVNVNRQIDEGQSFIQVTGPFTDMAFLSVLDLGVDLNHVEKTHILRTRLWNECMGLLGINNANQDKKERLVSDEVGANDDQIENMRYVNLNARKHAADQINLKYNMNIQVDFNTDVAEKADQLFMNSFAGGAK